MKLYDVTNLIVPYDLTLEASPNGPLCLADDVQKMRARLLVKLLRERIKRYEDFDLLKTNIDWFTSTADRIEEKFL